MTVNEFMDQGWQIEKQKSRSPSPRTFLSRTLKRFEGSSDDFSEDLKGPIGLNTLFEPLKSAIADLIFVHGLGGGSRSTWTKSSDPSLYWPQEWLPQDPGFEDTRIHSFGYNSNLEKESILNIHDFAKSLLCSIQDCPAIPRESNVPLVLIGHSMGGLVIKKAFILARQVAEFKSIAHRVRAMFFLATPHRGSDLASLLSKILQLTSGPRPFVLDLHRNSLATHSINDEFPQHCQDLQLYSFYETLPTNYGFGKGLIVDKDLAILGYPNERTSYIYADHRGICKYSSQTDPNYLTIRNALASTISKFRDLHTSSKRSPDPDQQRAVGDFLGIWDAPEDDFMGIDSQRMRGSCGWLTRRESFQIWRDATSSQIYWISAKPATGKSVLSGYVINHLKESNLDCVFYFFAYGDKVKSCISSFLRSMAWQMASLHPEILQVVLEICEKDAQLCKMDYRSIWRKLFLEGILKVGIDRPQYWVIDALDECKAGNEMVLLLLKITETSNIRILVTSRYRFEWHSQIAQPKTTVISEEILAEDTNSDISLYLEANMEYLPLVDKEARQNMVGTILRKSNGCFLWVSLVLQELRQVHMSAEIRQVLEDIPSDMDELYSRILDSMSRAPYGKVLAKAILTWTVCAVRPLTTDELYHALRIDINDTIDSVEKSIVASCGQLVYVDPQSRVQMVHQTARDFLLRSNSVSEFAINSKLGHKRLAMTCLKYLNGNEMKGPRHRRLSVSNVAPERCPFAGYACNAVFEHINQVSSTDDDILAALAKFLSSYNVLSWIEYLAQSSGLNRLIHAGKAFRHFLQRRSKHMSPFGREVAILDSWATDLVRLVTKFGKNLTSYPSSIYHLIPPFCPSDTAPKRQFASSTRGISVVGLSNTTWDDCLVTIVHEHQQLLALACSSKHFAIGLSNGNVTVYHETACQEAQVLNHGEPVRVLKFGEMGQTLASSGTKFVRLWDTSSWQEFWTFNITSLCMSMAFTDSDRLLLGALKENHVMIWDLTSGTLKDSADWTRDLEGQRAHAFRRPTVAEFCMDLSLLAVVYRGQDILLWDLERDATYATFSKETLDGEKLTNTTVTNLVFSNAPDANLLAVAYWDGDLLLFDTSDGSTKERILANAQILVSSPDGRTLATGGSAGTIQLFEFETLKLLYRINSDDYGIKSLAFSWDSQRLLDIRGSYCRVWDPMALARQDADDDTSDTVSISTAPQEIKLNNPDDVILITALACHESGEAFFCGKEDGSVWLCESKSGQQTEKLFRHAEGVSIVSLYYKNGFLSSIDSSSRVVTRKILRQPKGWGASEPMFDHRADTAVEQLLSNKENTRMLICTATSDILCSITPEGCGTLEVNPRRKQGPHRWASHPTNPDHLILVVNNVAHLYAWQTLEVITGEEGIPLEGSLPPTLTIRSITPCFSGAMHAIAFAESSSARRSRFKLLLFRTDHFTPHSKRAVSIPKYQHLADNVEFLIGAYGQRLVFQDSSGWVCSVDAETQNSHIVRHFFIPADWLSSNSRLMVEVTRNGDIILVKRDEVAVIKRGLDNIEQRPQNNLDRRSSLLAVPNISH